jgi:hypothetical protein
MRRKTRVTLLAGLAGATLGLGLWQCAKPAKTLEEQASELTISNYSVPLSPATDPEGKFGSKGLTAFFYQFDPIGQKDPDSPYDAVIITPPFPWGESTQEEKEAMLASGEAKISYAGVRRSFYDEMGQSQDRLREHIGAPVQAYKILTSRQENATPFDFENFFSEYAETIPGENPFGFPDLEKYRGPPEG